ncbi:MAG TPA: DUF4160 domain-containing protein, partial [Polyangiaceae bacterium]|nr:DUF4160 domain-containing protein [Polyangiaceae bacterium]
GDLSPTIFRHGPYRFFFFSREEERPHVHILSVDGETMFWIEPTVALAHFEGLDQRQLKQLRKPLLCRNSIEPKPPPEGGGFVCAPEGA